MRTRSEVGFDATDEGDDLVVDVIHHSAFSVVAIRQHDEAAILGAGVLAGFAPCRRAGSSPPTWLPERCRETPWRPKAESRCSSWNVFSKSVPRASRSDVLIVIFGSRQILAGGSPSAKKCHPESSSSLLILIRAMASFMKNRSLYSCSGPNSATIEWFGSSVEAPRVSGGSG